MKISGTVELVDLGPGAVVLRADDGKRYQLTGGDRSLRKAGQRVEIDGDVDPAAMSSAMVGPILKVRGYKPL